MSLESIRLPDGFEIELFAADVPNARSMAMGDANTLFVGTRNQGEVYAIPLEADADGALRAGERRTLASGLNRPNGVAYRDGALYVAEVNRILRFDDIESRLDDPQFEVIRDDLSLGATPWLEVHRIRSGRQALHTYWRAV